MAQNSDIPWTEQTWNPLRGCSKESPGCENCYAMFTASRFIGPGQPYEGLAKRNPTNWTGELRLIEDKLYEPLRRRKPTTYFVNSMSDLFHEKVPDEWIDRVFAIMALCQRHTFQVLTKRAKRLPEYVTEASRKRIYKAIEDIGFPPVASSYGGISRWPLENLWLGVSVENRQHGLPRIDHLRRTSAAVRFLSIEPLLEDLGELDLAGIDWVIVGGESAQGGKCRWCNVDWIRSIVEQCQAADVPCFVKQLGSMVEEKWPLADELLGKPVSQKLEFRDKKGGDPSEWPADLRVRQFPRALEAVS